MLLMVGMSKNDRLDRPSSKPYVIDQQSERAWRATRHKCDPHEVVGVGSRKRRDRHHHLLPVTGRRKALNDRHLPLASEEHHERVGTTLFGLRVEAQLLL